MNRRNYSISALVAVLSASVAISVTLGSPHHSFAPYEQELQIKMTGVVTEFRWTNPHVYIQMDVTDETKSQTRRWLIECASPGILNRVGWKFNILKPGDKITVIVSPLRNGEPAALLKQITFADGSKLTNGGPAGPAKIQ